MSYLDPAAPWAAAIGATAGTRLQAAAIARVRLRYDDTKADLIHDEEYEAVLYPLPAIPSPSDFVSVDYDDRDLLDVAPQGSVYTLPVADIGRKTWWTDLKKGLTDHLVSTRRVQILANAELKLYSRVGESAEEFAGRCTLAADAKADAAIAALQKKYDTKLRTLRTRADTATSAAQRAAAQHTAQHGTGAQVTNLLGGLFGGARSRRSIVTDVRRASASASRVDAAQDKVTAAEQAILDIEAELRDEVTSIDAEWAARAAAITTMDVPLERTDVVVADLRLLWVPSRLTDPAKTALPCTGPGSVAREIATTGAAHVPSPSAGRGAARLP